MLDPDLDCVYIYGSAARHFAGKTLRRPRDVDYIGRAKDEASADQLRLLVHNWARANGYPLKMDGAISMGLNKIYLRCPEGMSDSVSAFALYGKAPVHWIPARNLSASIRLVAEKHPDDVSAMKELLLSIVRSPGQYNFFHCKNLVLDDFDNTFVQGDTYAGNSPYSLANAVAQLDSRVWALVVEALNSEILFYGTFLDKLISCPLPFKITCNPNGIFTGRNSDVYFFLDGLMLLTGTYLSFRQAIDFIWGKEDVIDVFRHYYRPLANGFMDRVHSEVLKAYQFEPDTRKWLISCQETTQIFEDQAYQSLRAREFLIKQFIGQ